MPRPELQGLVEPDARMGSAVRPEVGEDEGDGVELVDDRCQVPGIRVLGQEGILPDTGHDAGVKHEELPALPEALADEP